MSAGRGVCVVTGGAGFIGCALSRSLREHFHRVIAFDNLHPQIHPTRMRPPALHPDVELFQHDVTDAAAWDTLLASVQPTVMIHLAAETGTGQSLTEARRHAEVNVVGTAVMLDALTRAGQVPARFVLASSRAVYGEGAWRSREDRAIRYPGQRSRAQLADGIWDFPGLEPVPASAAWTQPSPVSVYGATKLAQEHMLSSWAASFGTELVILRLQNVYGPGQSLSNSYTGILPLFCRIAREGTSIPLYEDGTMLRDFVFIEDVASALMQAVRIDTPPRQPVDIGTGGRASISDVAHRIAHHYGAPVPHVCGKYRFGDVRHAACDIEETTRGFGWRPRRGLEDGVATLAGWVENELSGRAA
ncbi:NAD-dependent epimerase/dehydratase family protein [Roseomonas sp. CCTCC AB2023176]|uniref:NAD-dependent epimerase/dehydratase family protein n=1 Tax=Roseomonas sp. CCTCC AB2023176 TaxID=3342640 RepID=UPI0035E0DFD6